MAPKSFFNFDLTPKEEDPYTPKFTAAFPEPSYTQAEQSLDATPFFGGSGLDSAMAAKSLPEASAALGGAYQGLSGQRTKLMSELSQEQDGTDWGSVAKQAVAALFPILGGYALSGNVGGAYGAQVGGALQQQIVKSDKEDQLKRDFQIKSQIADIDKRQAAIAGNKLGIDKSVYAVENRPTPTSEISPEILGQRAAQIKAITENTEESQALDKIRANPRLSAAMDKVYEIANGHPELALTKEDESILLANKGIINKLPIAKGTLDSIEASLGMGGGAYNVTSGEIEGQIQALTSRRDGAPSDTLKGIFQGQINALNAAKAEADAGRPVASGRIEKILNPGNTAAGATARLEALNQDTSVKKGEFAKFESAVMLRPVLDDYINRTEQMYAGMSPAERVAKKTITQLFPGTEESVRDALGGYLSALQAVSIFGSGPGLSNKEGQIVKDFINGTAVLAADELVPLLKRMRDSTSLGLYNAAQFYKAIPAQRTKYDMLMTTPAYASLIKEGELLSNNLGAEEKLFNDKATAIQAEIINEKEAGKWTPARAAAVRQALSGRMNPDRIELILGN